jgi:hypothetical protein
MPGMVREWRPQGRQIAFIAESASARFAKPPPTAGERRFLVLVPGIISFSVLANLGVDAVEQRRLTSSQRSSFICRGLRARRIGSKILQRSQKYSYP